MEGFPDDSVSELEPMDRPLTVVPTKAWILKGFATFAAAVMVLVVFSQSVNPEASRLGGADVDEFEEQARRLTIAEGPSASPRLALAPDGTVHAAWVDGRGGTRGVYVKASRNGGLTFSGDRSLASGFESISDLSLTSDPGSPAVAVAWSGTAGPDGSRVYVRASPDGGASWARPTAVGPGGSASVSIASDHAFVAYVHGNGTSPTQVRLVDLALSEAGTVRDGRGLLAFNASASDVALYVANGTAHVVWADYLSGYVILAHIAVNVETGAASPAHLIATFRGNLGGCLALAGLGSRLALVWSDDASGSFDVKGRTTLDGGATWPVGLPVAAGTANALAPSAAFGRGGLLAVAWQDDRTGSWQVFGRVYATNGMPLTRALRVTASPTAARQPTVALGTGRDVVVAWSDGRHRDSEIYADLDVLLDRPRFETLGMFAKRLEAADFAPPPGDSRAALIDLIRDARGLAERREEAAAALALRTQVMTRFDGALGGDPGDDLVLNVTAQLELTRIAQGILRTLEGEGETRTRTHGDDDGEPDPPGPGEGEEPEPQPKTATGATRPPAPTVYHLVMDTITSTNAQVSWRVTAPDTPVYESWVGWGISSTWEHLTYDNSSPYSATISPLIPGTTYKIRAYAEYSFGIAFSNTYTFFVGVRIDSLSTTNVSSDRATVEWRTNVPATSVVYYGKNESNLNLTATGASGTFHQVNLTGLGMRETYYYRVRSVALADSALWNESGTHSFATEMRIENLTWAESLVAGSFSVTFEWDTNFNASSQIRYGENTTLMSRTNGTMGYHHVVTVSGLKSKTTYYWQAYSAVWNGTMWAVASGWTLSRNGTAIGNSTYIPPPEPKSESLLGSSPITSWAISIVNVTFDRQPNSITATWNTTYAGDTVLKYKTGTGGWNTISDSTPTLTHSVTASPLVSGTTYTFLLNSTSSSNPDDSASSGNRNATTRGIAISGTAATPDIYTAWVSWSTGTASATTVVRYGINSIWEKTAMGAEGVPHSLQLTGLLSGTAYKYRVESAATLNPNDVAVDVEWTFQTLEGPNDANASVDAAAAFASALHVEPGTWTGWINNNTPYFDWRDFYRFQVFAGQQIRAKMTHLPGFDLNLYLWRPTGTLAVQGSPCSPLPSECLTFDAGTQSGFWRLEVRLISGSGRMDYTLAFNATGGGVERFVVDVGSPGDTDYVAQTPGINVVTTNWTGFQVSPFTSTATDEYIGGARPDYREVLPANGTFYLNLHRTSWERYNDYLFTLQYYSTQDSNVSVWNGAGWVTVATVPGQSNWRAMSFLLEHTLFYDAEPARAGLNVKLRFEKPIQMDSIAAIPWKHTVYVGDGSDDLLDEVHVPGIRLLDGWINDGQGYKNATLAGGTIVVTPPDVSAGYTVTMRFDGNSSGITVQRWTGSAWTFAASLSDFSSGQAVFVLDPAWYVDAYPTWAGMNVKVRLVPTNRLNETTLFTMAPVHWTTDVGVTGDTVTSAHVPGLSVYPNAEWSGPLVVDGRTVRVGQPYADLYLNLPWPSGSMIAYVTYKATRAGTVELKTSSGETWVVVGTIVGDSTWRTTVLFAQGTAIGQGPEGGPGQALTTFHDHYGDAFVNADLRFNLGPGPGLAQVTVDTMWVDVDGDGDNLTSFGEPHPYAYSSSTPVILGPGQYFDVNWEALVEGRWQFTSIVRLNGMKDTQIYYAGLLASVDGAQVWTGTGGWSPNPRPPFVVSFSAMLCTGPHKLRFTGTEDLGGDVLAVSFRKLPTDPENPDTDGDGLRDGREACAKRTDPTRADTDADGLTDFEETYDFNHNNATVVGANATTNVTVDAAGEYRWTIKTSATPVGGPVKAVVYLDGQLKWSKESSTAWTDLAVTFDAILPKGLHSLQVQKATAKGSVTLKLVNVTTPQALRTNALFWDTDRDGLSDGDEILGRTGWMTSANKTDADGDGAPDGDEIRVLRSDPLLYDTDHDGYRDGIDLDPLHDLVVQLTATSFAVTDPANGFQYQARPTVGPNWTNSQPVPKSQLVYVHHNLSVNVRDDTSALVKVQVFRNDGAEIDVANGSQKPWTDFVDLRAPSRYNIVTIGDESTYATVAFDIKVIRVGKANTLLVVPNDWSTLSNGTVDSVPTGLHRFVGEQRFVVGLLNVTDGDGNVASYDAETRVGAFGGYQYRDASANALHACHAGDSPAKGYFGLGARLSGSGSYLMACGSSVSAKLNAIDGAFTVATWIKPEADYVQGTGWRWSFGRQDLWRLGYSGQGVKLEVWPASGGASRSASAAYPLYAGRWYHLAGTMRSGSGWTNLSVFVNGDLVAWTNGTAIQAKDGTADLVLGRDQATSGAYFHGIVDEFRLYNVGLSQDGVRGLMWFLHGANNVLLPRGIFFDSMMLETLSNQTLFTDPSNPLQGANLNANDNNLSSNLNSRVIQMVITKNLTLDEAWRILDLALANRTGNVTSFPLLATAEFYTLGLAQEVDDLLANTAVENSGNASTPAPPPSLWELWWNQIAGWASAAWNVVVAYWQFVLNVFKWLIDFFIGLFIGLTTGNWDYFNENVIDPLREAFEALFQFLIDLAASIVNGLIQAVVAMLAPLWSGLAGIYREFDEGVGGYSASGETSEFLVFAQSLTALIDLIALITLVLGVVLLVVGILTLPFSFVIGAVLTAIAVILVASLFAGTSNRLSSLPDVSGADPERPDQPAAQYAHINEQGEEDPSMTLFFEIVSAVFGLMAMWVALKLAAAIGEPTGFVGLIVDLAIAVGVVLFGIWLNQQAVPADARNLANMAIGAVLLTLGIFALIMDILLAPKVSLQPWQILLYSISWIFTGISLWTSAHLLGWI